MSGSQKPLRSGRGAPAAGDLLVQLDHPQISLDQVIVKWHPEVVREPQRLSLALIQAQQ